MTAKKKTVPKRLKRAESFIGIHFDFHAGDDCTRIGEGVTRRMVADIVRQVKPDYIQCDCKGHRGLSSYPTRAGHQAPGFARDQLKIWREVTAAHGVALFMHYSGVWDREAVRRHPSWARIDENGKRDPNNTSVFGPYVDKLLIPQMKELSDVYGVDGVWVDGECWSTARDYSKRALDAFRRETGIRRVPRKPEDEGYFEFSEFCRDAFRRYLKRYVDAMHAHNPDFQIASNWAYSSFMPEPVTVDVDYISGDYSMQNSVNTARIEARCMVHQGKPWDLMAWSFSGRFREQPYSTKTVAQLQREAAVVLAAGGGFQAYFKQKRDGSIFPWTMKLMAEVAAFCRARQAVTHRAMPVPQVGLLLSTHAFYRENPRLFSNFSGILKPLQGVLAALLEGQHSVEIVEEHHLEGRLSEYPLIVVPEWKELAPAFKRRLREYVRGGGRLLLIGPDAARLFKNELKVAFRGKAEERIRFLGHGGWLGGVRARMAAVTLKPGARAFGRLYQADDDRGPWEPAASVARLGKGAVAAVHFDVGARYVEGRTTVLRDFLSALVRELFPRPMVEVAGSHSVDLAVNRKDGRLCVNLVNTAGEHANPEVHTFDEIPPVGPLTVTVRLPKKPRRITRHPGGRSVRFAWRKGEAVVRLPRLAIHDILVVE